ncbi:MAG: hypothetical protein E7675_07790 [Ruminococcaceae bacterium]|nr:hypothetical protein [Oscillospiraceae bacterium]
MRKTVISVICILFSLTLMLGIISFGDTIDRERIIELRDRGMEEYRKAEEATEDLVVVYELSVLSSALNKKPLELSLYDIVKKAEDDQRKIYVSADNSGWVYKNIYNRYKESVGRKVSFRGSDYTVSDMIVFATFDSSLEFDIYFTKEGTDWVKLGYSGPCYTWEEFLELYESYLDYKKPIKSAFAFLDYISGIYPFEKADEQSLQGKDVTVEDYDDVIELISSNINSFKNGLYDGFSERDKKIILAYEGISEGNGDIIKTVTDAEKEGKLKYIVLDESDCLVANSAYETLDEVPDYVYLLPIASFFEKYPMGIKYDGENIEAKGKVYLWDKEYGFVGVFLTEKGAYASVYHFARKGMAVFPIEELPLFKECYDKYKEAYPLDLINFTSFVYSNYGKLNEDYKKSLDEIIEMKKSGKDSLDVDESVKDELGVSDGDTVISSHLSNYCQMFSRGIDVEGFYDISYKQKYYVIKESGDVIEYAFSGNDRTETELSYSKDIFMKMYDYATSPEKLFEKEVEIHGVHFFEESGRVLIVYIESEMGDYVLYTPSTWTENFEVYFMPVSEFTLCAIAVEENYYSLNGVGEGQGGYTYYRECYDYMIEGEKPTVLPETTIPAGTVTEMPTEIPETDDSSAATETIPADTTEEKDENTNNKDDTDNTDEKDNNKNGAVLWVSIAVIIAVGVIGLVYYIKGGSKKY